MIVSPPGLDYVASFLACLYAGVVAVPVYLPNPALLKRTLPRLLGVIADAAPAIVLAPASIASMSADLVESAPALGGLPWQVVDEVDPLAADNWRRPAVNDDDTAFLQYTSGSTGSPRAWYSAMRTFCTSLPASTALTYGREIGVDIAQVRPYPDAGALVAHEFSPAENAAFEALPAGARADCAIPGLTGAPVRTKLVGDSRLSGRSR